MCLSRYPRKLERIVTEPPSIYIYTPWPFLPFWGVVDNTKYNTIHTYKNAMNSQSLIRKWSDYRTKAILQWRKMKWLRPSFLPQIPLANPQKQCATPTNHGHPVMKYMMKWPRPSLLHIPSDMTRQTGKVKQTFIHPTMAKCTDRIFQKTQHSEGEK